MLKSLSLSVLCIALALTGCTTPPKKQVHSVKTASLAPMNFVPHAIHSDVKDPTIVAFYPAKTPIKHPYRIIGKEKVSRYNFIGMERQSNTLDELMRKIAASMGGDAIINITQDNQKIEGTVISYERVLL